MSEEKKGTMTVTANATELDDGEDIHVAIELPTDVACEMRDVLVMRKVADDRPELPTAASWKRAMEVVVAHRARS